jgi:hypothetical protein
VSTRQKDATFISGENSRGLLTEGLKDSTCDGNFPYFPNWLSHFVSALKLYFCLYQLLPFKRRIAVLQECLISTSNLNT